MKNKILILLVLAALFAGCKQEGSGTFPVRPDLDRITFTPIAGGAVMSYVLPDESVYGIKVEYNNVNGRRQTMIGSYGESELMLRGFTGAETSVKASITLIGFDGSESAAVETTFSTLDASSLAIFEGIRVDPYWSGIRVRFTADDNPDGFISVGYMGINPRTQEPGVVLLGTVGIKAGENVMNFGEINDNGEEIDVVVWTDDFDGNPVHREEYSVIPLKVKKLDMSGAVYTGSTAEDARFYISWRYLFDGDTNGVQRASYPVGDRVMYSYFFSTNAAATAHPVGVIDLGYPQTIASMRYYAPQWLADDELGLRGWSNYQPEDSMPNHFKVWAGNSSDPNDESAWTEVGEFYQYKLEPPSQWWCYPMISTNSQARIADLEALEAADPCYVNVPFDLLDYDCRYLKIQFFDTFAQRAGNYNVGCQEIEVYVAE